MDATFFGSAVEFFQVAVKTFDLGKELYVEGILVKQTEGSTAATS
jgi:hypothetical protein